MALGRVERIRRFTYRHRQLLGSISAAFAVLFLFTSLRSTPTVDGVPSVAPALAANQVAVPITLRSTAITSAVRMGDTVDIVSTNAAGSPELLAGNATVIDIPGGGGFTPTQSAVIVVGVDQSAGLALATNLSPHLSLIIHSR